MDASSPVDGSPPLDAPAPDASVSPAAVMKDVKARLHEAVPLAWMKKRLTSFESLLE